MTGPEGRSPSLRLCSYNVRKAVGLDWRRQPDRCLEALAAVGPDIAVLQEADRRLAPRRAAIPPALIEEITGMVPLRVAANDVSLGWHGNAVLVREGIVADEIRRLDLPGIEPRGAVIVELRTPGARLALAAVHLGLRRACRSLQLAVILRHVEEAGGPAVIAGDYNEWRDGRVHLELPPRYEVVAPGRSFHSARPVARLDRFALGPGLRATGGGVERGPAARVASDHLPVWVDLTIADEAGEAGRGRSPRPDADRAADR